VLLGYKKAVDTTPKVVIMLMTGRDCPVQLFRVGANVYATQCHSEGDPEHALTSSSLKLVLLISYRHWIVRISRPYLQ